MDELIGEFTLKNDYTIYRTKEGYKSVSKKKTQEYVQHIPDEVYESAKIQLSGREWSVGEAAERLEVIAKSDNWPFYYGHKLKFFSQAILLAIVANGEGDFDKESHSFIYTVF